MSQKQRLEVGFEDVALRYAVTHLIENINTLLDPVVLAIRRKPEWVEMWRDAKTIPDGYSFAGDKAPRPASIRASVIYNTEHQIGKITIEIVEDNQTPYGPSLPLRKARIYRDAVFCEDIDHAIRVAINHFDDNADYYCKRKNDEVKS